LIKIAVDAMGGDQGPKVVIQGALAAAKEYGVSVVLVGKKDIIEKELNNYKISDSFLPSQIRTVEATEVIEMRESPINALKKNNSSISVAIKLLKNNEVDGVISAGNTGAALVASRKYLGNLKGIRRPAIATVIPNQEDITVVIDAGANVDCKPQDLVEFAIMGEVYAEYILSKINPRIGILSIGEERTKGNSTTLKTYEILENTPLNFIGNVEGRDINKGSVDVVVCDGFVGNVILKLTEGFAEMVFKSFKKMLKDKDMVAVENILHSLKRKFDYTEYGGAPLLGIKGICIIAHGSSSAYAIQNAVRVAVESVKQKVNDHIEILMANKGY